jgi:glutamine cyclotransferase
MAANSKTSLRKKRGGFPPVDQPITKTGHSPAPPASGRRWGLVALFLIVSLGGTYLAVWLKQGPGALKIGYEVVNTYPHDPHAYTQGLLWADGALYESTGQTGRSSIRKVDLKTGEVLQKKDLAADIFAEGLALANDQFFQLTWKDNVIFVYDRDFQLIKQVPYDHDGWGLTFDGEYLIASDGTAYLRFLDPESLKEVRSIRVRLGNRPVGQLNELEMHGPDLYANVYQTDFIHWIDVTSGNVKATIDLAGLWPLKDRPNRNAVLNGIAIDPKTERLFVTGKDCPFLWEIKLVEKR